MMNIPAHPASGASAGVPPSFAANPASGSGGAAFSRFMADASQGAEAKAQTPVALHPGSRADSDSAQAQRVSDKARASARDAARNAARSAEGAAKAPPKEVTTPVIDKLAQTDTDTDTDTDIDDRMTQAAAAAAAVAAARATPELSAWAAALTRTMPPDAEGDSTPSGAQAATEGPALAEAGATRKSHDPARTLARWQAAQGAPGNGLGHNVDADLATATDLRRATEPVTAGPTMHSPAEAAITAGSNAAASTAAGTVGVGWQNSEAKALERVAQSASIGDVTALVGSHAAQGAAGATALPETLAVQVSTPADAPEFREALGVQVSLLARDGVHSAELHLNPAEMGPISVHIVMDGAQARVDFGADSANTRELIESGLPELAAALRDAGFTLAGGGVSQHSAGSQGRSPDSADSRSNAAAAGASRAARRSVDTLAEVPLAQASMRMRVPHSGLDLYA